MTCKIFFLFVLTAGAALATDQVQTVPARQLRAETNGWVNLKPYYVGPYAASNPVPTVANGQAFLNWIDYNWSFLATIAQLDAATNTLWNDVWTEYARLGTLNTNNLLLYYPYIDLDNRNNVTNLIAGSGIGLARVDGTYVISNTQTPSTNTPGGGSFTGAVAVLLITNGVSGNFRKTTDVFYTATNFATVFMDPTITVTATPSDYYITTSMEGYYYVTIFGNLPVPPSGLRGIDMEFGACFQNVDFPGIPLAYYQEMTTTYASTHNQPLAISGVVRLTPSSVVRVAITHHDTSVKVPVTYEVKQVSLLLEYLGPL